MNKLGISMGISVMLLPMSVWSADEQGEAAKNTVSKSEPIQMIEDNAALFSSYDNFKRVKAESSLKPNDRRSDVQQLDVKDVAAQ